MRIGWHGLSVPLTAGVGGYVIRRLAIGAEFSYIHALFLAAGLRHPDLNLVTPLALIESAAQEAGTNLRQDLPTFWTLVLSARVRI